jgi:GT2 family glycosyltransferase
MKPVISVITLTYNKLAVTRTCLLSWLQSACSPWELIVVENGSTDGTREWLKDLTKAAEKAGVGLQIIRHPRNVGCSTARNKGMAAAQGDRIVFVDNDVALRSRGWLAGLAACLDRDPKVAVAGPKLVYPSPPHLIQCAGVGISRSGRVLFRGRGESKDDSRFNRREEVQCLISACFMARKSVLNEVGGFDEAFNPVQFEDFDLCYRIRSKGHKVVYEPSVEMYHFESTTTAGTPTLPNTGVIVRHGLLFKKRWKHMFEREDGPADDETRWRKIKLPSFESVGELPVI